MLDLYYKTAAGDEDYDINQIDEDDPLKIYLQQLKLVLSNDTPVIGATDMMSFLEEYIYEFELDTKEITTKIHELINTYCSLSTVFKTSVNVRFLKGTLRDVCIVDITVNKVKLRILVK